MPELCFSTLPGTGELIGIKRGESSCMDNEMILTFMMSQAQAESESLSTNIKWG